MPTKKSSKKSNKSQTKKYASARTKQNKKSAAKKPLALTKTQSEQKEKTCWDYTTEEWLAKETKRIDLEFKKYAPDLKPNSGKSAEWLARTAMTLAHHGTKEAIEALKKFKKDPRAPMWIDCGIEECEMIHWDDTVGRQLDKAEEDLTKAAEEVMAEKLIWDKDIITGALKAILTQNKIKFAYGETVKLHLAPSASPQSPERDCGGQAGKPSQSSPRDCDEAEKDRAISEDKAEFIIDNILLVGIKPSFADWMIRFKQGLEGKDLRKGDLENIEQNTIYDEDGKKLEEPRTLQQGFDEFYEQQFYNLLRMSKKPQGILLDFSGDKLYGEYFSLPQKSGWETDGCSGWCEGCLKEAKCETAQERKEEEDKKRYRILKKLIKEIVEIEKNIESTKRPSVDLEYEIEIAKKLKAGIAEKIKQEKNQEKIKKLQDDLERWNYDIIGLQTVLMSDQPKPDEKERLKTLKEMYDAIKREVQTKEYKNDVEGLEVYYGKAEPTSEENAACYHDPLCECDELEPLNMEESCYQHADEEIDMDEVPF
ncbi:hypothetical protein L6267_02925 [Candidatus Parcubacteria bacterium]|nr:hypothetical protein [Candidatus Parcubacteria bacterium]